MQFFTTSMELSQMIIQVEVLVAVYVLLTSLDRNAASMVGEGEIPGSDWEDSHRGYLVGPLG